VSESVSESVSVSVSVAVLCVCVCVSVWNALSAPEQSREQLRAFVHSPLYPEVGSLSRARSLGRESESERRGGERYLANVA
jgi:hypothetical protein